MNGQKRLLPPTLTSLAASKKAVTFWVIFGIYMTWDKLGLDDKFIWPLCAAFGAYVLGQGLADFGHGVGNGKGKAKA
jgi:hypothetical protein